MGRIEVYNALGDGTWVDLNDVPIHIFVTCQVCGKKTASQDIIITTQITESLSADAAWSCRLCMTADD